MARPLIFRAWDKTKNQMILANVIDFRDNSVASVETIDGYKVEGDLNLELMQFTGLTDKNGVKIFEGDIVENHTTRTVFNSNIRNYESISNTTRFCVVFDSNWGCFKFTEESERGVFAVIGNIFENPELVGV